MKKPKRKGANYSKRNPVVNKYEKSKKECTVCKGSYNGTRYQRFCDRCRKIVSNIMWEEYEC